MFTTILNRFNQRSGKAKTAVAAMVCAAGLGIGFVGSVVLKATEPQPYEYCQNQGASYTCTPVPISCTSIVNCYALAAGTSVCDDSTQVQGCKSSFWDYKCGAAPNYQCDMAANYTGYCVDGVCTLGTPFMAPCAKKDQLAQCQTTN